MRRKSGEYVWVETTAQCVAIEPDGVVQLISCSRDITTRKRAEFERAITEERRAAAFVSEQAARAAVERALAETELARLEAVQANRAKDEFLQMLSHEFRTPLTTIKTAARLLLDDGESAAERQDYLETIATECDRQIDMIINLLDVSRLEEGSADLKYGPVAIDDVLQSCHRIEQSAARIRGQELGVHALAVPPVRGDAKALRRVFCAMIENAVKYTPEGGQIVISAELTSSGEVAVHITDTGRGIQQTDLPHIFEKFYRGSKPSDPRIDGTPDDAAGRAETPGVGLGLYLAYRLIRALDGRIVVSSTVGRGSRFSVYLRVWDDAVHHVDDQDGYGFEELVVRHD